MTKRRRKKIDKIMFNPAHDYIRKGKFDYLHKQGKLYEKYEEYLRKMNNRSFNRFAKRLLEKYKEE